MVAERTMAIAKLIGKMPTVSYLKETSQNDLANQITRRGGFISWADRLGLKRDHSDSDTVWDGEKKVERILVSHGLQAERQSAVKWPFDILVNGILRIDVKSARYAEYGPCKGWFYRIGKVPQADLIALHQIDSGSTFYIPWFKVPSSNITISVGGGIYASYMNAIDVVKEMAAMRSMEKLAFELK